MGAPQPEGVDGRRALEHVQALVRFGERSPGSAGHRQAERYISGQLRRAGIGVEEVNFQARTPRGPLPMKNIIGKIPGESDSIVVLAGHYDTLEQTGFLGANDGGSSTALLLELGRVWARRAVKPVTVWLAFFDGEEALREWSREDGLYGSRHQVGVWEREGILGRIRAVIVVDMVGDRQLNFRREANSTGWLVDLLWQVAHQLGYQSRFSEEGRAVVDDHVPFLEAGVPAANLIDFDYGLGNRYWHTREDTPDKLSAESFRIVGRVVLGTLDRLGSRWPTHSRQDEQD